MENVRALCIEGVCVTLYDNWENWPEGKEDELRSLLRELNQVEPGTFNSDDKLSLSFRETRTEALEHYIHYDPWIRSRGNIDVTPTHPQWGELLLSLQYYPFQTANQRQTFHFFRVPSYNYEGQEVSHPAIEKSMNQALSSLRYYGLFPESEAIEVAVIIRDPSRPMEFKKVAGYHSIDEIGLTAVVVSSAFLNFGQDKLLPHELSHLYLHLYDKDIPVWLNEGFAKLAEGYEPDLSLNDYFDRKLSLFAKLYHEKYFSPLAELSVGNGERTLPSSYDVAQAVFIFLEDTQGIDKVREFVSQLRTVKDTETALFSVMGYPDLKELQDAYQVWIMEKFAAHDPEIKTHTSLFNQTEGRATKVYLINSKNSSGGIESLMNVYPAVSGLGPYLNFDVVIELQKEAIPKINYSNPRLYRITVSPEAMTPETLNNLFDEARIAEGIRRAGNLAQSTNQSFALASHGAALSNLSNKDILEVAEDPLFWVYLEGQYGEEKRQTVWKAFLHEGLERFKEALPPDALIEFPCWIGALNNDAEGIESMDGRCLETEGVIQIAPLLQPRFSLDGRVDLLAGVHLLFTSAQHTGFTIILDLRGAFSNFTNATPYVDISGALVFQERVHGFYVDIGGGHSRALHVGSPENSFLRLDAANYLFAGAGWRFHLQDRLYLRTGAESAVAFSSDSDRDKPSTIFFSPTVDLTYHF